MYQVKDEPIETIHLYVVREEPPRPSRTGIILSVIALSILIAIGVLTPYQQPEQRVSIRVPAVPVGMRSFTASVAIVPTGIKTYPATSAHGTLTITNGSVIGQSIPAGFSVQGVITDNAVYVPGGSADGFGKASISARAGNPGKNGNILALAINAVIGSSVYIRNLSAFSGGRDAYSVTYVTEQDRQTAIKQARSQLTTTVIGLHYPCAENLFGVSTKMAVTWRCQFVAYHVPSYMHVLSSLVVGKNIVLEVIFTPPPTHIWVK